MTLSELIERVEKLEGPDRDVDYEIGRVIISDQWQDAVDDGGRPYKRNHAFYHQQRIGDSQPTASLDAAIALTERVLPGWSWECRASGTGDKGQATVWNPLKAPGHNDEQRAYNCPSPAIALILATLRALSAQERDDDR